MQHQHNQQLNEGLRPMDLAEMVEDTFDVDTFKSKMGEDRDVCVLSFKIKDRNPAKDLMEFIEKNFEFVLDADVSSGEMNDGDYIVFVEIKRSQELPQQIYDMMDILKNLTGIDPEEWRVRYYHKSQDHELKPEVLARLIPLSPREYDSRFGEKEPEPNREVDAMRTAAGLKSKIKAPKNEFTDQLKAAAGIT